MLAEKKKYTYKSVCRNNEIQSTLVISNSLISNNRLSRSENLVPVLTEIYQQETKYCGQEEEQFLLFSTIILIYL